MALIVSAVVAGCGGPHMQPRAESVTLRVYAPWSMEKRMRRIFEKFQMNDPAVRFRLETGTPGRLVKRMKAGERPDVYVSMGPAGIERLTSLGIVREGTARQILEQRLVLICSETMTDKVRSLKDLARSDVRTVGIGRPSLSAGTFSRMALNKAGILEAVEPKARISPLRSHMQGKVDAAIVLSECCYDEDLICGRMVLRRGIHVVQPLPESLCPPFPILAVAIKGSAQASAAEEFVDFLTRPAAQSILRRRGPEACPICDGEKCVLPEKQTRPYR